jgi:predicted Fe-Mo cluster-binding NifX family protein
MKILLSAATPGLDSAVDPRFGRAAYYIIVDTDTLEWQAHPNPAAGASGGAGTQAAQFAAGQGVQAAISGDFGPNAYNALAAAGIAMHLLGASRTVDQAVKQFKSGQLEQAGAPPSTARHPG